MVILGGNGLHDHALLIHCIGLHLFCRGSYGGCNGFFKNAERPYGEQQNRCDDHDHCLYVSALIYCLVHLSSYLQPEGCLKIMGSITQIPLFIKPAGNSGIVLFSFFCCFSF